MASIPQHVSESTRRLNPHLYGGAQPECMAAVRPKEPQLIRQSTKPLMNELEKNWLMHLQLLHPNVTFRPQAKRYRISAGAWYKPDVTAVIDGVETAYETKGSRAMKNVDRGILALKATAALWPEVAFHIVWRGSDRSWQVQRVLP